MSAELKDDVILATFEKRTESLLYYSGHNTQKAPTYRRNFGTLKSDDEDDIWFSTPTVISYEKSPSAIPYGIARMFDKVQSEWEDLIAGIGSPANTAANTIQKMDNEEEVECAMQMAEEVSASYLRREFNNLLQNPRYRGKHIAVIGESIVDSDESGSKLVSRVSKNHAGEFFGIAHIRPVDYDLVDDDDVCLDRD